MAEQQNHPGHAETGDPFADVAWHDALELGIEGRWWQDTAGPYDRLPARAEGMVRQEVWARSRQPAGLSVRFRTDATDIFARWRLRDELDAPENATAFRVGGLDCYGRGEDGKWYWAGCCAPSQWPEADGCLNGAPLDGVRREYRVYLPLDGGVEELLVGVRSDARLEACRGDERRPIVIYGTSIVQGSGASRPGMAHASILQRRLDYPVINLGFGGNGTMDAPVAELIAEIDAALYVIDCLPNIDGDQVRRRMGPLVEILRSRRPETPILFVGDRLFGDGAFIPSRRQMQAERSAAQRDVFEAVRRKGVVNLHLLDERNFFGEDFEGTVDGSHPSDLGALRMAEALEPAVRGLLF